MLPFLTLLSLLTTLVKAGPRATSSSNCVGTIASLSDVNAAVQCTTVNIHEFTVPAGETFALNLLQGTTVNVLGNIQFETKNWEGPLFQVQGEDITFNGNGKTWNGGGPDYWDGRGGSGSVKPDPMMLLVISGTLSDVHVVNSPERCFSLSNVGPLTVSGVVIDNREGNYPNDKSNGLPAGRNTDGFDVSGDDLVIENSSVINQDDCLAIDSGKNITFQDNYCDGGHGISIGSISSNVVVEDITIRGNTVVNSEQAFRIKTDQTATNSRVSNVVYSGNIARNCTSYGVLITQSYPATMGMPGDGVIISDVSFSQSTTEVNTEDNAEVIAVNCGTNSCTGKWDWSSLETSGGKVGTLKNYPNIYGYDL